MIIRPYSFDGTSLQSTDYEAFIPRSSSLAQLEANLVYTRRMGAHPMYAGKDLQPTAITLEIKLLHDTMTLLESINTVFDVTEETPKVLIVEDTQDSNKQYYVYATPKQVLGGHDGQMVYVTLGLDDAIWQTVTQNSQTWNITAVGQSTDFVNSGNIEAYPIFEITPTAYPSLGYIYSNEIEYIPQTTLGYWRNRPLEILGDTNGVGMDTAALVTANKAQASGNDFRVYVNNAEVDRWFGGAGFNTTDTKCWINIPNQPPKVTFTLKTAIDSTSPSSDISIEFNFTNTAKNNFSAYLRNFGILKIDSEEFLYTSRTITDTQIIATGITRAQRNTSAGAHAVNATVTWIPYSIKIVYGSSDATAPDIDNNVQPILNLTTSSNLSFVYDKFKDNDYYRSPAFDAWGSGTIFDDRGGEVITVGQLKSFYTGVNNGGDTDPADVLGLYVGASYYNGAWISGSVNSWWETRIMDGISAVTYTYERYQYIGQSPLITTETRKDSGWWVAGRTFSNLTTTDLQTWVTGTDATSDVTVETDACLLRFYMRGQASGVSGNKILFGVKTLTVTITNPPTTTRRGEQSHYTSLFVLTNSQTNQSVTVKTLLQINDTLIVDTDPNFPNATLNGSPVNSVVSIDEIRPDWLPLAVGTNTITATADRIGAITIVVKWRDRMNIL